MSLEVDIRKTFGSYSLDVSFTAENEVFGLLGASGCGKSLTMRSIAGIETPDEGRIVVNGQVFFDSEQRINLKPQQRKTALLFQNYMLFPNLTVEDNVAAGIPKSTPKAERDAIVLEELKRFDVASFAKRYPAQLSGGQQQRVALARLLAARPGILMLDEPFSALDSHLRAKPHRLVRRVRWYHPLREPRYRRGRALLRHHCGHGAGQADGDRQGA